VNKSSVVGKILIEGTLILKSPLLIGDGSGETADNFRDVHAIRNLDDKPFIPGTSLCGVLRDWLTRTKPDAVTEIFGNLDAMQSSIQTDDIELVDFDIIARDGVRLDDVTGTVDDDGDDDFYVDSFSRLWGERTNSAGDWITLTDKPRKISMTLPCTFDDKKFYGLTTRNYIGSDEATGLSGYVDYRFVAIEPADWDGD